MTDGIWQFTLRATPGGDDLLRRLAKRERGGEREGGKSGDKERIARDSHRAPWRLWGICSFKLWICGLLEIPQHVKVLLLQSSGTKSFQEHLLCFCLKSISVQVVFTPMFFPLQNVWVTFKETGRSWVVHADCKHPSKHHWYQYFIYI